jgi:chemotaxis-related protein WspB
MDGSFFGLDVGRVMELVPWVELWPVKSAPDSIRGCFDYRGSMTPVVDMSMLFSGRPSKKAFSSRIAIAPWGDKLLGLLLEDAIETLEISDADFQTPCVKPEGTPYLGRMLVKDGVLLQLVEPEKVIPGSLKAILYPDDSKEGRK